MLLYNQNLEKTPKRKSPKLPPLKSLKLSASSQICAPSQLFSEHKIFTGVYAMMKKMHVSSIPVHTALQLCLKTKLFEPIDGYENLTAEFAPWKSHPKYSAMCQGHWNSQNQLDGLAVRITPYK